MANYLAIDFGTTNCVASIIDLETSKIRFAELEVPSQSMPSAIFVKLVDAVDFVVSERQRRNRFDQKKQSLKYKFASVESEIDSQVLLFRDTRAPRVKAPRAVEFLSQKSYFKAYAAYQIDLRDLPRRRAAFEIDVAEYEAQLRAARLFPSDEAIEREVTVELMKEMLDDNLSQLREYSIFSAIEDPKFNILYGSEAIDAYCENPYCGFFMRSPKAFLGSALSQVHQEVFTRIVSLILAEIKRRSELFFGETFDGAVIGYPVNYIGSQFGGSNANALSIMRSASSAAGFSSTRFVMEPFAALLSVSRRVFDSNTPVIMIDMGGGTTDVAYCSVDNSETPSLCVIRATGGRVGGNDFDESIALNAFSEMLGSGERLTDGSSVPRSFVTSAFSTRDLQAQLQFRRDFQKIFDLVSRSGGIASMRRLLKVNQHQLQHLLMLKAEQIKFLRSGDSEALVLVDCFEDSFCFGADAVDYDTCCGVHERAILKLIAEALGTPESVGSPVRVFLTGGMAMSAPLVDSISRVLPERSSLNRLPVFNSVSAGLAVISRQLTIAGSIVFEPSQFRGVSIDQ